MVDYREILRLDAEGYSQREIARSVHSSHHTVADVLQTADQKGLKWPVDQDFGNDKLQEILFPEKHSSYSGYLIPDYGYIHKELAKPGVTLTLLWSEYVRKCEDCGKKPYMTTQFGDKYREWAKITKATMRISHKPGVAMEVDWAGNTLFWKDPVTGESIPVYLFIAVLPCSCYTYAEVCPDMKLENWLLCHVHAFSFFGGVTLLLIPDNLKTGVVKNSRYETVLNRSYKELSEYYNTAIVPTRVEHPKDKAHAENSVNFASTWITAALRNEHFFSFDEIHRAVSDKLTELNERKFTGGRKGCRHSAFIEEESAFLKPLPFRPYEISTWLPPLKVGYDYVVSDGLNKYSVPFDLIGKAVDIKLTTDTVEIYCKGNRVASHHRENKRLNSPVVNPDHMPEEHKKYLTYNSESFQSWAKEAGTHILYVINHFLRAGKSPEQGYKACVSLMKLAEKYGTARLDSVCESICRYSSEPTLRIITTALKNGYASRQDAGTKPSTDDSFGITRGAEYFRKGGDKK